MVWKITKDIEKEELSMDLNLEYFNLILKR